MRNNPRAASQSITLKRIFLVGFVLFSLVIVRFSVSSMIDPLLNRSFRYFCSTSFQRTLAVDVNRILTIQIPCWENGAVQIQLLRGIACYLVQYWYSYNLPMHLLSSAAPEAHRVDIHELNALIKIVMQEEAAVPLPGYSKGDMKSLPSQGEPSTHSEHVNSLQASEEPLQEVIKTSQRSTSPLLINAYESHLILTLRYANGASYSCLISSSCSSPAVP